MFEKDYEEMESMVAAFKIQKEFDYDIDKIYAHFKGSSIIFSEDDRSKIEMYNEIAKRILKELE